MGRPGPVAGDVPARLRGMVTVAASECFQLFFRERSVFAPPEITFARFQPVSRFGRG